MDIKEKLEQAVEARKNLEKQQAIQEPKVTLASFINQYLENNLPKAIATGEHVVVMQLYPMDTPSYLWDELARFVPSVREWVSHNKLIGDYVDDVYKPYLTGDTIVRVENQNRIDIIFEIKDHM